jgi:hypothetical protein
MAATLLIKDALWRVSVLLMDTAPQFQRWPERELVMWWNDAQRAIAKYLPMACSRLDAFKCAAGTRQSLENIPAANLVPGDGVALSGPVYGIQLLSPRRNMGADGSTPGAAIRVVERDMLDVNDPDWHTRTATVVRSVVFDPNTPRYFYITPGAPASPAVWIEIAYNAKPIDIAAGGVPGSELYGFGGTSTVKISVDDEYLEECVNYVVARANMKDSKYADPAKATAHANLFLNALNSKVAAVTGNNPNLKMLPGVHVTPVQQQ